MHASISPSVLVLTNKYVWVMGICATRLNWTPGYSINGDGKEETTRISNSIRVPLIFNQTIKRTYDSMNLYQILTKCFSFIFPHFFFLLYLSSVQFVLGRGPLFLDLSLNRLHIYVNIYT